MLLEEYFDFVAEDDIRLRGTRIGVESILYEYLYQAQPAEAIATQFPTVSLEAVYATILYYLQHPTQMERYMAHWLSGQTEARAQQMRNPPPVLLRLQKQKQQLHMVEALAV
jgi:uncharacterized protein (DUF433 family)